MKILIDFTQIPVKRTGAGVYAENLVRELPAFLQCGDQLVLLVQSDEETMPQLLRDVANLQILSIPSRIFRNRIVLMFFEQILLPWILIIHRIDVLHSLHYTLPLYAPASRVVTFHDLTMLQSPLLHTRSRRWIMPVYMRLAWRLADAILFVSASTEKDAERLFPPSQKCRAVTPLGVSDNAFVNVSASEIREWVTQFELTQPYLLFVGTIEPRKNLVRLIQAFEAIADQFPQCTLVLAGELGWDYEPVVQAATSSPVSHRIRHIGYVSDQARRVLLAGCSALVYPSLYEGFGLPVVEGMAAGVPVITSNVSSLPEVAGTAALLVDPTSVEQLSNAMKTLLMEPNLAKEYGRRGRERARTFSWSRTAAMTYRAYQAVFGLI
jgi:glycosyltransferase involved in cell wall biosynthesis